MTLVWRLILNKYMCSTLAGFKGKFSKEEAKLKKLSKYLKVMRTEKAQLELDNRTLRFKLNAVVAVEADLKARYKVELKVVKEGLNNFEAMIAEKDRQLVEAREKVEKVKAEQTKAEAKAVMSYKEKAPNTPEYLQLANLFLTADGEQLVQTRMGHFIP
ncbi:hypothetical protein Adt_11717 [Abeliophyllum distichum]|uniref:Flotillin-like n=1 Tax=Abeliophyllum distichum TaxID=126358 RepID=A0ABD1UNM5_9LAMI